MLLVESILGYADVFNTPRAPKNQMEHRHIYMSQDWSKEQSIEN